MTDYIPNVGDRLFVFGSTSMFQYKVLTDDDNNDLLDLHKVWQAGHVSETNKDNLRSSMRKRNEKAGNRPNPSTPIDGVDYTIVKGDRVFVFGFNKMYEYRWNIDNSGNELLDLFKIWKAKDVDEDIKDRLRENIKEKNTGVIDPVKVPPNPEPPQKILEETTVGIDASLKKKGGKP